MTARPEWASSGGFYALCTDLESAGAAGAYQGVTRRGLLHQKKGRALRAAFIEYLLADQSCRLGVDLIKALLAPPQSSPPAAAAPLPVPPPQPPPAAAPAAAAQGISNTADDMRRLGAAAAARVDVAARQRELLQGYGKKELAEEREELRGAPDPGCARC